MSSATSTLPLLAADATELRKQTADWHASLLLDGAPEPLGASARALLAFYRDAARRRLDAAAVEAELKSVLGDDVAAACGQAWERNAGAARRALLLSGIDAARLVDVDWTFGVTASSSEHAAVGSTYVQLRLAVQRGAALEYVHLELTLERFYEFLHELERAKAACDVI